MDHESFKPAPVKSEISFADVDRIDVRVGTILSVEDIDGSDKLLKLTVDFGDHRRSILAGMKKEREHPREIEGQQALFVINLEAKKMMIEGATPIASQNHSRQRTARARLAM